MKKSVLLIAIGGLLPVSTIPICIRYVEGPEDTEGILVEVDSTLVGSYLPTSGLYSTEISKGKHYTFHDGLLDGDTVYITVKAIKKGARYNSFTGFRESTMLVKGKKLDSQSIYNVIIDNNNNVTFTKTDEPCVRRSKEEIMQELPKQFKALKE